MGHIHGSDCLSYDGVASESRRCQPAPEKELCVLPASTFFRGIMLLCLLAFGGCSLSVRAAIETATLNRLKHATVFVSLGQKKNAPSGSGFLVHRDGQRGLVVTNAHVVDRAASDSIDVIFNSGTRRERTLEARLIGRSRSADLAILEIEGNALPEPILLSKDVQVRETEDVLIIGFPFGKGFATNRDTPAITISKGIVSSLRLDINDEPKLVQIDGDINPGNSGGPIVNEAGELVGVAVATVKKTHIGFAVPVARLRSSLEGMLVDLEARPRKDAILVRANKLDPLHRIQSAELVVEAAREAEIVALRDSTGRWRALSSDADGVAFSNDASGTMSAVHPLAGKLAADQVLVGQIRIHSASGTRHLAPFRIEPRSLAVVLQGPNVYPSEARSDGELRSDRADLDSGEKRPSADTTAIHDLLVKTGLDSLILKTAAPSDRLFGGKTSDPEEQTIRQRLLEALVADWPQERVREHYVQIFVEADHPHAVNQVTDVMDLPAMQTLHRTLESFDGVKESVVKSYLSELRRNDEAWEKRLQLMKEIEELRNFSKSISSAVGMSHATLTTLLNELKPRSTRKSQPILERDIENTVAAMHARAKRRVPEFMLFLYRDASNEDLQDYLGLLKTKSLRWFAAREHEAYTSLARERFASAEDELVALFRELRREVFGLDEGPSIAGLSDTEAVKAIIDSYGKDAVIDFLLDERGGEITIQQGGGFRTAYGRPRKDLVTDASLLRDLSELRMTPEAFVRAMDDHQVEMKFRERRLDANTRRARLIAALRAYQQRKGKPPRSRRISRQSSSTDRRCVQGCSQSYNSCIVATRRSVKVCLDAAYQEGKSAREAPHCAEQGSGQARECAARRGQCANACP